MFWGLILEPHRRYTHKVEKPFHISMAALDVSVADNQVVQVMCYHENTNFLVCTLKKPDMLQCTLDLNFATGTEVGFGTNGNGIVHLTGYLTDQGEDHEANQVEEENGIQEVNDDEEEIEEKEEAPKEKSKRKKKKKKNNKHEQSVEPQSKKQKLSFAENEAELELEEEESDDPDFIVDEDVFNLSVEEEEVDDDEEEETEDDDDDDDDDEDEDEGDVDDEEVEEEEEEEEEEDIQQKAIPLEVENEKNLKKATGKAPRERTVTNGDIGLGIKVIDKRLGHGPKATTGDFITVDYVGKLQKTNKTFDSGKNFTFKLGAKQVISGWDEGLINASPGGFRELICPPQKAYGVKGCPPTIPPNSTLKFLITVKSLKRKGKVYK